MSLPARERWALGAIEGALEASEPRMTAMFAIFARLTRGEELTSAERLSRRRLIRWRPGIGYFLFPALASIALITVLVVGLATSSARACGTTALAPPAPRPGVSCAALNHQEGR
jgi:hypothetical protein